MLGSVRCCSQRVPPPLLVTLERIWHSPGLSVPALGAQ